MYHHLQELEGSSDTTMFLKCCGIIWKRRIPLKIKLFSWLLLRQRLMTCSLRQRFCPAAQRSARFVAASAKIVLICSSSVHLLMRHGGQHLLAVLMYPRLNLSFPLLPGGCFGAPLNGTQSSPTCGRFGYIRTRWSSEVDPHPSMLSSTALRESHTHGIEEASASRILCLCK